ncbi:hypothetical protein [Pseudomonas luteola]|uniref:hypothetical protein n=1 Tax=Pseudomonas luteola TaxID=47886 RepID=UPI00289FB303|nr:hypothetical protein [Pseudomonas luteola]
MHAQSGQLIQDKCHVTAAIFRRGKLAVRAWPYGLLFYEVPPDAKLAQQYSSDHFIKTHISLSAFRGSRLFNL